MLNDKANHASEITDLRSRIVTLESDNAALTNERDEALRVTFDVRVIEQLAAAQATNAKLREAMLSVLCDPEGVPCFEGSDGDRAVIAEALVLPNDTTALDARLAQERKEIADTCDRFHERGMTPAECAAHIRSMT